MKTIPSLAFRCSRGRKRRLKRFSPRGSFYIRLNIQGKDIWRSLGTTDERAALEKGKFEVEQAYKVALGEIAPNDKRKFCSLGDIVDRYEPDAAKVKPATATQYRSSFLLLCRQGGGLTTDAREASAEILRDVIGKFKAVRLRALRERNLKERESGMVSIDGTITQARALFKPEFMHFYKGLRLPDLAEFRAEPRLKAKRSCSFVPFPEGLIERIEELIESMLARHLAAKAKGDEHRARYFRNVYLALVLMRWLGLRNNEVEHGQWEWFLRNRDGEVELSVELRGYFAVKNESVRTILAPESVVERLRPFWRKPNEWIMDAPTATERHDLANREINRWLRPLMPDRQKCAYELRKNAGSEVLSRPESEGGGLAAAARFLGDTISTTERYYVRLLKPVRGPRPEDRPRFVAALKIA